MTSFADGDLSMLKNLINPWKANLAQGVDHPYFLPICLSLALVIRVGWVYILEVEPVSDFRWYYERGLDFAAGHGYSVGPEAFWPKNIPPRSLEPALNNEGGRSLTAYWPVGYPAFLGLLFSLFGSSLFIAKIANVILSIWILFFSYYIAKTLFNSELSGRITLLILAFYPDHIAYSSLLASEILFLFLLLLGVALLIKPRLGTGLAGAAGIIFGLACLVKPQVILVPAILFIVLLAPHIKQKTLAEYGLAFIVVHLALGLTILPWLIRNYQVFHHFVFISTNGGYNLLVGNHPAATGKYNFNNQIVSSLSDAQNEYQRDRKAFQLAVAYMLDHPLKTIHHWPKKLWYLYGRDTSGIAWNMAGLQTASDNLARIFLTWLKLLAQLYYMFIGAGFLLSIFLIMQNLKNRVRVQPFPTLGLWLALYFTFIALLTFGDSRFHFPIIPWIAIHTSALAVIKIKPEQPGLSRLEAG